MLLADVQMLDLLVSLWGFYEILLGIFLLGVSIKIMRMLHSHLCSYTIYDFGDLWSWFDEPSEGHQFNQLRGRYIYEFILVDVPFS